MLPISCLKILANSYVVFAFIYIFCAEEKNGHAESGVT